MCHSYPTVHLLREVNNSVFAEKTEIPVHIDCVRRGKVIARVSPWITLPRRVKSTRILNGLPLERLNWRPNIDSPGFILHIDCLV